MSAEGWLRFERRRRAPLGINIVPLVDVVFLLLVFFMLASSFMREEAIELRPPAGAPADEDGIAVSVSPDGGVTLGGKPLDLDRLEEELRKEIAGDPDRAVAIRAAREVPVQRFLEVLDRVRTAGSRNVQIVAPGKDEAEP